MACSGSMSFSEVLKKETVHKEFSKSTDAQKVHFSLDSYMEYYKLLAPNAELRSCLLRCITATAYFAVEISCMRRFLLNS